MDEHIRSMSLSQRQRYDQILQEIDEHAQQEQQYIDGLANEQSQIY